MAKRNSGWRMLLASRRSWATLCPTAVIPKHLPRRAHGQRRWAVKGGLARRPPHRRRPAVGGLQRLVVDEDGGGQGPLARHPRHRLGRALPPARRALGRSLSAGASALCSVKASALSIAPHHSHDLGSGIPMHAHVAHQSRLIVKLSDSIREEHDKTTVSDPRRRQDGRPHPVGKAPRVQPRKD